ISLPGWPTLEANCRATSSPDVRKLNIERAAENLKTLIQAESSAWTSSPTGHISGKDFNIRLSPLMTLLGIKDEKFEHQSFALVPVPVCFEQATPPQSTFDFQLHPKV